MDYGVHSYIEFISVEYNKKPMLRLSFCKYLSCAYYVSSSISKRRKTTINKIFFKKDKICTAEIYLILRMICSRQIGF